MKPLPNEKTLIEQAQAGDKAAISALYEAYAHPIFQYLSYRAPSDMVAEDLTADVFIKMVDALPNYRYTGAPLGAWLFRIAANQLSEYYRQNKKVTLTELHPSYRSQQSDPSDQMAEREEFENLRNALQTLSDDYQNIIVLRFMQDLPHTQVASIMERTEAAVRVLQHRALKALEKALNKQNLAMGGGAHG